MYGAVSEFAVEWLVYRAGLFWSLVDKARIVFMALSQSPCVLRQSTGEGFFF